MGGKQNFNAKNAKAQRRKGGGRLRKNDYEDPPSSEHYRGQARTEKKVKNVLEP
jgi:hypothetical protein